MKSPQKLLTDLGFPPLKKLGQNFLINPSSAAKIYAAAAPPAGVPVLEIGPGLGALTAVLQAHKHPLSLVEKDSRLQAHLADHFSDVQIYEADFLDWDLSQMRAEPFFVFSNLPYQVATPIIEKLLVHRAQIEGMCFLMQKEMADRICAQPGVKNYGRLSVWLQTLCNVRAGHVLSPGNFFPSPSVQSKLVHLSPRAEPFFKSMSEENAFLQFVAKLFGKRRKMLRSILKDLYTASRLNELDAGFLQRRPETLSLDELYALFRKLN